MESTNDLLNIKNFVCESIPNILISFKLTENIFFESTVRTFNIILSQNETIQCA